MNEHLIICVRALEAMYVRPRATRQDVLDADRKIDAAIAAVQLAFKEAERYGKLGRMLDSAEYFVLIEHERTSFALVTKAALDALLDKEPT